MTTATKHWTSDDIESFAYRVAFDFVAYVTTLLESGNFSQQQLAERLGVSEGRVSQILNSPGNLTLKQIVRLARALGRKVAVVPYDDGDADNFKGPISSAVFTACWEFANKPADLFEVPSQVSATSAAAIVAEQIHLEMSAVAAVGLSKMGVLLKTAFPGRTIGSSNSSVLLVEQPVAAVQTKLQTTFATGTGNRSDRAEVTSYA